MEKEKNTIQKLVNYQSNHISLTEIPFSEFQLNVFYCVVQEINKYEENFAITSGNSIFPEVSIKVDDYPNLKIPKDRKRVIKDLKEVVDIKIQESNETRDKVSVLFTSAEYNYKKKEKVIKIGINPFFIPQFRRLNGNYTQYFLDEALSITGKYCKNLYVALSCKSHVNQWVVEIESLKKTVDCKSYAACKIIDRVIKPLQKVSHEHKLYFDFEPMRQGKGGKITKIKFYNIKYLVPKQGNLAENLTPEQRFLNIRKDMLTLLEKFKVNSKEMKNNAISKEEIQFFEQSLIVNMKDGTAEKKDNIIHIVFNTYPSNFDLSSYISDHTSCQFDNFEEMSEMEKKFFYEKQDDFQKKFDSIVSKIRFALLVPLQKYFGEREKDCFPKILYKYKTVIPTSKN